VVYAPPAKRAACRVRARPGRGAVTRFVKTGDRPSSRRGYLIINGVGDPVRRVLDALPWRRLAAVRSKNGLGLAG